MKFFMNNKAENAVIPQMAMNEAGINSEVGLICRTVPNAILVTKNNTTLEELIEMECALYSAIIEMCAEAVGECIDYRTTEDDSRMEQGPLISISKELLNDAGIPIDASLDVNVDPSAGTISISKSAKECNLNEVEKEIVAFLEKSGVSREEIIKMLKEKGFENITPK